MLVLPRLVSQAKNSLPKLTGSAMVCTLDLQYYFLFFSHQPLLKMKPFQFETQA